MGGGEYMDFAPITTEIATLAPLAVTALVGVIAGAISIKALKWGFPLVVGFFTKNAK
jgi:hypothetical protein